MFEILQDLLFGGRCYIPLTSSIWTRVSFYLVEKNFQKKKKKSNIPFLKNTEIFFKLTNFLHIVQASNQDTKGLSTFIAGL